jgi:hypothetical protein
MTSNSGDIQNSADQYLSPTQDDPSNIDDVSDVESFSRTIPNVEDADDDDELESTDLQEEDDRDATQVIKVDHEPENDLDKTPTLREHSPTPEREQSIQVCN